MSSYGGYDVAELAELYDHVPAYATRADVKFYLDRCREAQGAVLELGCGTGRLLIPAAEAGCSITGIDWSEQMLDRCRTKLADAPAETRERVSLVLGNMADFHLDREFSLIMIPFRPFQHLVSVYDQLRCLRCVYDHLSPRGKLVFDVFHVDPLLNLGPAPSEEVDDTPEFQLPDGRLLRRAFRIVARNRSEQCNLVEIIYYINEPNRETRRVVHAFPFRYYYRYEVEHLLARAGLHVIELYGNFNASPFVNDSPEMIFVAGRAD